MKKPAIIWDIDGVICNSWRPEFKDQFEAGNYEPFEAGIPEYEPYGWAVIMLQLIAKSQIQILFVTARNEDYKTATEEWIQKHIGIEPNQYKMYMRPPDSREKDYILKLRLWDELKEKFDILYALDDKIENAKLWKDLGVPSLHVLL